MKEGLLALLLLPAPARAVEPPARVASLNLTADEILVEILPPHRLVAVTAWADDPHMSNVAGRVPSSAYRFQKSNLERLVALAPDLVVVSEYTDADFLHLLEGSGLRHHRMTGLNSLAGYRAALLDLGRAVGAPEAAARLAARYDAVLAELSRRLSGAAPPRVLYWADPHSAGEGTAFDALIEAAGGRNVGRELGLKGIMPVGAERAFLTDPDVILVGTWEGAASSLKEHPLLSRMRAVREGRVVEMPTELLVTLSHHAAEACWYLGHALHPDRVPRALP
ncbi:MAG TPA: ABC transporter substrate-binding protein [Vicinamibacteria bacterium]|jgi:iron complex transport system substrate-binding protein|nr:ABC transporter substrate-binding protein [Vicinamibacteria bacterium]